MKATFPDGTVFEGTPEEFIAIRRESTEMPGHKGATKTHNGAPLWNEKKAHAFWDSLDVWHGGGRQQKILRFLIDKGGSATEEDIWKHLGIEKGQELAGVLANLTRNARREARNDHVRAIEWRFDQKHACHYFIPDELLQFLKQF